MAGIGGAFAGLLSNNVLEQIAIWQVGGSLIGAALGPYMRALTNEVNQLTPLEPLSPAEAAAAVIRNVWSADQAAHEASFSGVNRERFDVLARLSGQAPGAGDLAVALRRKLIDHGRYLEGVRQGNLRDEWADLVQQLSIQQPSPTAMIDAYLEGQISEGEARTRYQQLGGDPDYFDILYNASGQAPTPTQALDLANRGIIPWDGEGEGVVSFRQAFLEGPWRNKWEQPFRALGEYLPPPRTVTAMYGEGSLSRDEAVTLLRKQGLSAEMAAKYVSAGSNVKTAPTRDLAQTTILELYRDQLIDRNTAGGMLTSLGYDPSEADFVLQIADVQLAQRFLGSAIARVHPLFVGHKVNDSTAQSVLAQLQVPAGNIQTLLEIWGYERAANVATLTAAQIAGSYKDELIDQADAQARLEQLGYTPQDAWLYLSQHVHRKLPLQPAAGATFEPNAVADIETLTAAQVSSAFEQGMISQAEAIVRLGAMGYSEHEAWLYLSIRHKKALPDEPAGA
jgi:hypothetical protein